MKKLFKVYILCSLLLSVSVFFACSESEITFCHTKSELKAGCDETPKSAETCFICTSHSETLGLINPAVSKFALSPKYLGVITYSFFKGYKTFKLSTPDRPPSSLA